MKAISTETKKLIGLLAALSTLVAVAATPALGQGLDPAIEAALKHRAAEQLDQRDHVVRSQAGRDSESGVQRMVDHNARLDPAIAAAINNRPSVSRDWEDNYGGVQDLESPVTATVSDDGFEWGDAGIGAGTVLGVMLLAGLATFFARGSRQQPKSV